MLTYRRGTTDDIEGISELLAKSGLFWPGAAATPYVAEDEGRIVGVYFKCVCFHAEPLAIEPGHNVSVTEMAKVMRADLEELATELGEPIVVYAGVQNTPKALAAAEKNGLKSTGLFLHEIVIEPLQRAEEAPVEEEELISAPPLN